MTAWVCVTCGVQFAPTDQPPPACPVCEDERQYVGPDGQQWTTVAELARDHANRVEACEPGLTGIGTEPRFAIGQRALHVGTLLWDCITLVDEPTADRLEALGGVDVIAISHPHYYSSMVDWAERLDARILLHADDREWVMRPDPRIEHWDGERLALDGGLELVRLGGHFAGATVCVWPDGAGGRGAVLAGDVIQVVADTDWASFMWSYPNLIPLPAREVRRIRSVIETLEFDVVYGAWWPAVMRGDAKAKTLRSADRYLTHLE
jgi:hypothetical protein